MLSFLETADQQRACDDINNKNRGYPDTLFLRAKTSKTLFLAARNAKNTFDSFALAPFALGSMTWQNSRYYT
jgi:hypothetical protein